METTSTVVRHWEDVVFENRNKDYGAYSLRNAYARRLMIGLGVTVVIVTILLSLQSLPGKGKTVPAPELPYFRDRTRKLSEPPVFKRDQTTQTRTHQRQPATQNTEVLVVRDSVPASEIAPITDFVYAAGEQADGSGIADGEGIIPVEMPVNPVLPELLDIAEVMPSYEGGVEAMMKFIQKKIRYPRAPIRQGIEGTVYVRFVVRGDGSVTGVQVIRGVHPDYDKEAVRVISLLPRWKGGSHNGRPVSVRMVLPITFNLNNI